MRHIPRIYLNDSLVIDKTIILSKTHAHYLFNVMRVEESQEILVFNGIDGEFKAIIQEASKKQVSIEINSKTREQTNLSNIHLFFAPIKGNRNENIIEKATEIGVKSITPVITERTIVRKANIEKFQTIAIEAAEQCERINIPNINESISLEHFMSLKHQGIVIFADETGAESKISDLDLQKYLADESNEIGLLIGPEGGFSDKERNMLLELSFISPICLGTNILRADTACYAGLVLIQSAIGNM